MRESFIFYRSFFDAIKELDDKKRLKMYDLISNFALNGEENEEIKGICKQFFTLIKPQIVANNYKNEQYLKDVENGKKGAAYGKLGGRPKRNNKNEETPGGFLENNPPKNPINENENVNVNVNINAAAKTAEEKTTKTFTDPFVGGHISKFYLECERIWGFKPRLKTEQMTALCGLIQEIPDFWENLKRVWEALKKQKEWVFKDGSKQPTRPLWIFKGNNFTDYLDKLNVQKAEDEAKKEFEEIPMGNACFAVKDKYGNIRILEHYGDIRGSTLSEMSKTQKALYYWIGGQKDCPDAIKEKLSKLTG